MRAFTTGFTHELLKLATTDAGEPSTAVYNDSVETTRAAMEGSQGKLKQLGGITATSQRTPIGKTVPSPETTPTQMQAFSR